MREQINENKKDPRFAPRPRQPLKKECPLVKQEVLTFYKSNESLRVKREAELNLKLLMGQKLPISWN